MTVLRVSLFPSLYFELASGVSLYTSTNTHKCRVPGARVPSAIAPWKKGEKTTMPPHFLPSFFSLVGKDTPTSTRLNSIVANDVVAQALEDF